MIFQMTSMFLSGRTTPDNPEETHTDTWKTYTHRLNLILTKRPYNSEKATLNLVVFFFVWLVVVFFLLNNTFLRLL